MAGLIQSSTIDKNNSIADHVHAALECFQLLLSYGAQLNEEDDIRDKKALFNALKESYGRFRIWCANIAAHRRDKTSLDYRLRGSPQIKLNIIKMVEDLRELLLEGKDHFLFLRYNLSGRTPSKPLLIDFLKLRSETLFSRSS